jgi:mycofactocin precursor
MSETKPCASDAAVSGDTAAVEEMSDQAPLDEEALLDEELEEELIIEDFTIDGICGVY